MTEPCELPDHPTIREIAQWVGRGCGPPAPRLRLYCHPLALQFILMHYPPEQDTAEAKNFPFSGIPAVMQVSMKPGEWDLVVLETEGGEHKIGSGNVLQESPKMLERQWWEARAREITL